MRAAELPEEIWSCVLEYLDVPDLKQVSMTSHKLRRLAVDPILHRHRRWTTARWLDSGALNRPSPRELVSRHILMSSMGLSPVQTPHYLELVYTLYHNIKVDTVNRELSRRPTREELMRRGILRPGGKFAATMRSIERQRTLDAVRAFFKGPQRPTLQKAINRGVVAEADVNHKPVSTLRRMFSYWLEREHQPLVAASKDAPTRANVLKLRKLFEEGQLQLQPEDQSAPKLKQQRTGIEWGVVHELRQRFNEIVCL
jgi:hypothetical protein